MVILYSSWLISRIHVLTIWCSIHVKKTSEVVSGGRTMCLPATWNWRTSCRMEQQQHGWPLKLRLLKPRLAEVILFSRLDARRQDWHPNFWKEQNVQKEKANKDHQIEYHHHFGGLDGTHGLDFFLTSHRAQLRVPRIRTSCPKMRQRKSVWLGLVGKVPRQIGAAVTAKFQRPFGKQTQIWINMEYHLYMGDFQYPCLITQMVCSKK